MNKKIYQLMSILAIFALMLGNTYIAAGASTIYRKPILQSQVIEIPAFSGAEGFRENIVGSRSETVYKDINTNDSGNRSLRSSVVATTLTAIPIPINGLTRPMKYYGVDRGSPFTDANYATLAQHAVKTIIIDTFINDASNSSSAKWSNIRALATKYNFNYVIWPNQGGDVSGCGWETPFNSPQNSDYIWRVTTMLDSFSTDPHFIGMVSAHEPMWNTSTCKTSISDMASIKTQLKNYMKTKGRTDFKVWNYIDNVSDLKNMSGFTSADIERVMDVAVTWQHCFGGAEGTCSNAKNKIISDRAMINNAGFDGKVELVYLFQTFATDGGYSMPTLADMQAWDCQFVATNAIDGFMYYTWGAWYSTDLINHPELWPEMNRVYDNCINSVSPIVVSNIRANPNPTNAFSVDFTVTFSESVTGVGTTDFALTTSPGLSGTSITSVTPVSGTAYTVTVNTGTGGGTIRLDVPTTATITGSSALSGLPYIYGEIYSVRSIDVLIGGALQGSYFLTTDQGTRDSYTGVNNGPARVVSSTTNILNSTRVLFGGVSYSELMGFPANQLTNNYWFPYYNNVAMDSQLRVSNVGGAATTITVTYGNNKPLDSFPLAAGVATRINYPNINSGPLHVVSSASNILTTLRVLYGGLSYYELVGFPDNQLEKDYWFPYYNNVAMDSQLRVSNVGDADTTITVTYGSNKPLDSFPLVKGAATRINYLDINSGPLHVTSTASNILTTIRVLYGGRSFSEISGYPNGKLTKEYYYPIYDNVTTNAQLRISNVGGSPTTITVTYGNNIPLDSYSLAAGAATRINYPGINNGPLHVVSSASNILTTQRLLYTTPTFGSFYELTGFPDDQLTTDYYFPWYNNTAMDSQLRIAVP